MSAALLPDSAPSPTGSGAERRRHERLDFRTAVIAIVDGPDGFCCLRCQTDDVSFEGARLICFDPLPAPTLFLRILMPGLAERFVEADVVNERIHSELRIGAGRESRYIYGVRFRRIVSDAETLELLRIAAAPASEGGAGI
jgi:hypothetical protein